MAVRLIQVPYDSGRRAERMGAGPPRLVAAGLPERLGEADPDVRLATVESELAFRTEIATAFGLHRAVAGLVRDAAAEGAFPVVLSGNCNSAIGTLSGLQAAHPDEPFGVVWFDGHGEFNTPETDAEGFLDAMGLSTLTGRCWATLAASVPGFRPLPDERVVLVGAHGADEGARRGLAASGVVVAGTAEVRRRGLARALRPALDALRGRGVARLYVHLDPDVLDRAAVGAAANGYAPARGGLTPDEVLEGVRLAGERFGIAAAGVASYDPALDVEGRVGAAGLAFVEAVAARRWVRSAA